MQRLDHIRKPSGSVASFKNKILVKTKADQKCNFATIGKT